MKYCGSYVFALNAIHPCPNLSCFSQCNSVKCHQKDIHLWHSKSAWADISERENYLFRFDSHNSIFRDSARQEGKLKG